MSRYCDHPICIWFLFSFRFTSQSEPSIPSFPSAHSYLFSSFSTARCEPLCANSSPCSLMPLTSVPVYRPSHGQLSQTTSSPLLSSGGRGAVSLSAGLTGLANLLAAVIKSPVPEIYEVRCM